MSDSIEAAREGITDNVLTFLKGEDGIEKGEAKKADAVAKMVATGATPDMLCDPTRKGIEAYGIDRKLIDNEVPERLAFYEGIRNIIIDSWPVKMEPVKKVLRREPGTNGKWAFVIPAKERTASQQAAYDEHNGRPGGYMGRLRKQLDAAVNPKTKTTKVADPIEKLRKRLEDAKKSIEDLADANVQERMRPAQDAIEAALAALKV